MATSVTAISLIDIDETFLPVGRMRQVARVTELTDQEIAGEVDLGPDHWVFPEHFPGDPIFPGVLLIEAAGQLVALWAWSQGLRGKPRLVRTSAAFHAPVTPAEAHLALRARVMKKRNLQFATVEIHAGSLSVATIDAVLAVLSPSDASR